MTGLETAPPFVLSENTTEEAIIGGSTDTGDPAVVALFASKPGASSGVLCSATVVSPTILLTAAHCVSPASIGTGMVFRAYTGPDLMRADPTKWIPVSQVKWDTAFSLSKLTDGHDIAIAVLAKATTIAPKPIQLKPLPALPAQAAVRLVGYGVNNGAAQTGAGIKRQVTTTLRGVQPKLLWIGDSARETCNGDSGGPAFMQIGGREVLVGVTSFGTLGCTGGGYDTRTDAYAALLASWGVR